MIERAADLPEDTWAPGYSIDTPDGWQRVDIADPIPDILSQNGISPEDPRYEEFRRIAVQSAIAGHQASFELDVRRRQVEVVHRYDFKYLLEHTPEDRRAELEVTVARMMRSIGPDQIVAYLLKGKVPSLGDRSPMEVFLSDDPEDKETFEQLIELFEFPDIGGS